jgi:hypothetical protein
MASKTCGSRIQSRNVTVQLMRLPLTTSLQGLAVVLCLLGTASWLSAHPFHTSSAEMEWNPLNCRYEIALKMLAADLEEALSRQAARAPQLTPGTGLTDTAREPTTATPARVDLERTLGLDKHVEAYLNKTFRLSVEAAATEAATPRENKEKDHLRSVGVAAETGDGATAHTGALHYVGMELEGASVWLYFELSPPSAQGPHVLTNKLLFEVNSGQINTCILNAGGSKRSLRFTSRLPAVTLPPVKQD